MHREKGTEKNAGSVNLQKGVIPDADPPGSPGSPEDGLPRAWAALPESPPPQVQEKEAYPDRRAVLPLLLLQGQQVPPSAKALPGPEERSHCRMHPERSGTLPAADPGYRLRLPMVPEKQECTLQRLPIGNAVFYKPFGIPVGKGFIHIPAQTQIPGRQQPEQCGSCRCGHAKPAALFPRSL